MLGCNLICFVQSLDKPKDLWTNTYASMCLICFGGVGGVVGGVLEALLLCFGKFFVGKCKEVM